VAIKGGDLIHVGNKVLLDRAQTAGPGQVSIDREKIYELGNYYSLSSILGTPDLTFSLESFDVSAEFEALLVNLPFSATNGSQTLVQSGNPSGGTFTITVAGQTTTDLAYNASAADVQTALEALSNLVPGDVYVQVPSIGTYTITFSSAYLTANTNVQPVTASAANLTTAGTGTPAITVTTSDGVRMADGTVLKPAKAVPMDIASAFKPGVQATNAYQTIGSVAIPYLQLESIQYQFGISDNARQTASLRGDSLFYIQNTAWIEEFTGTNTANQAVTVAHPAVVYKGDTVNGDRYALSVSLASSGKRLLPGDYTESVTGGALTVTVLAPVPVTDQIRVIYGSSETQQFYPQASHAPVSPVRPAAIKGRNVQVYVGGINLANRWTSVQQASVQWQVTLEKDEELGNANAVSQTYDVPAVTGSIDLKPRDYAELYAKICQIAGVTPGQVAGPLTTVPLELLIVLYSPTPGSPSPGTPGRPATTRSSPSRSPSRATPVT
jgi:hypothetical protein